MNLKKSVIWAIIALESIPFIHLGRQVYSNIKSPEEGFFPPDPRIERTYTPHPSDLSDILEKSTPEELILKMETSGLVSHFCGNEPFYLKNEAYGDILNKYPKLFEAADRFIENNKINGIEFDRSLMYALITHESNIPSYYERGIFEPKNGIIKFVSSAGALGPLGIIPDTLHDYNRRHPDNQFTEEDMFDYYKNMVVFLDNFNELLEKFGNNLWAALMAHNRGSRNVEQMIEKYGTDYSKIFKALDKASKKNDKYEEPRDFVAKVLGQSRELWSVLVNEGKYFIPDKDTPEFEKWYSLFGRYLLDEQNYPSFVSGKKVESPYLSVSHGYASKRIKNLMKVRYINNIPVEPYLVKDGDTLWGLLNGPYKGVSRDGLNRVNKCVDLSNIQPDDVLYFPKPRPKS